MKFKYQIGDRVKITNRPSECHTSYSWIKSMDIFDGKTVTISQHLKYGFGFAPAYSIEEDTTDCGWCEHWFDPLLDMPDDLFEI